MLLLFIFLLIFLAGLFWIMTLPFKAVTGVRRTTKAIKSGKPNRNNPSVIDLIHYGLTKNKRR